MFHNHEDLCSVLSAVRSSPTHNHTEIQVLHFNRRDFWLTEELLQCVTMKMLKANNTLSVMPAGCDSSFSVILHQHLPGKIPFSPFPCTIGQKSQCNWDSWLASVAVYLVVWKMEISITPNSQLPVFCLTCKKVLVQQMPKCQLHLHVWMHGMHCCTKLFKIVDVSAANAKHLKGTFESHCLCTILCCNQWIWVSVQLLIDDKLALAKHFFRLRSWYPKEWIKKWTSETS